MNSIERVKAAVHFEGPDRVPVFNLAFADVFPMLTMTSKKWQPGYNENEVDLFPHEKFWGWKRPEWAKKPKYKGNNWKKLPHEEIDEWGAIWSLSGRRDNMGHPGRPSMPDWNQYEEYIKKYTPDVKDKSRYFLFLKLAKIIGRKKYRMIMIRSGPSAYIGRIRGFDNYLIDHRKHPQELKRMISLFTDYFIDTMRMWKKLGADPHGLQFANDYGEQSGPFFSPKIFKEFYETFYRTICDEAHSMNMEVHQHCCGKMDVLIPSLIEWGLDALEFDSPRMNGYNDLKPYRGKIMMWGCVNIQSIYPNGTPEECEREVWHMMRNLGTKDGGFGAAFYDDLKAIQTPKQNARAFKSGLKNYGIYSKIPEEWWENPVPEKWTVNGEDIVPPLPPILF